MSELIRVLQVEDSESDAALTVRQIEKAGYRVQSERVESAEELRKALARQEWDVVISDYSLPNFDAPSALKVVHELGCDIPFIVASGSIGEDRAVAMMKAGAHDYVLKDATSRLVPAMQREIREARSRRERRRAEERLRDRDELLAMAIDATQLGMFDYYPQTGELIWPETLKRQFALPPDAEVSYDTFLRGLHPDDRERVENTVQHSLDPANGGEFAADYRTIGVEDHAERWISARGRVFFDVEPRAYRFVGMTLDITDRKRLEDQFRQAQKLESLGRLAGGVAHDFNNLLTVIQGHCQMTLDDLPPADPLRDGLEEVLKAATRANFLTRQLLAFARPKSSEPETILLNSLVSDVRKMLVRLVGEDIRMVVSLDPEAGAILADPGHIEQVLMNLVVNARDAMPNGGEITIETQHFSVDEAFAESHPDVRPGPYTALTVSDTGMGMADDVMAHLFEPFFTTKEPGKGTGLGLSTVYGIVKQSGGSISVESASGRGARFRILLPAVNATVTARPAASSSVTLTGTETIVVAEDQGGVRNFVRLNLQRAGYTVLECVNGSETLELVNNHSGPIHLLLADAVMPEMGGVELAARFEERRPGVPVLFMSGYSEHLWSGGRGSAGYLQKPFSAETLLTRVRAILDAAASSPARTASS